MRGRDRKLDAARGLRKSSRKKKNSTEQLKRIQKPIGRLINRQTERQKIKTAELFSMRRQGGKEFVVELL